MREAQRFHSRQADQRRRTKVARSRPDLPKTDQTSPSHIAQKVGTEFEFQCQFAISGAASASVLSIVCQRGTEHHRLACPGTDKCHRCININAEIFASHTLPLSQVLERPRFLPGFELLADSTLPIANRKLALRDYVLTTYAGIA